jgi:hypothetical protein
VCCSFTLSPFSCFIDDPNGTKHSLIASKTWQDGSVPFPECLHINSHKCDSNYVFYDEFFFFYMPDPHICS